MASEKTLNLLSWIGVGLFGVMTLCALSIGGYVAAILFLAAAVAMMPIEPVKALWRKLPKKIVWVKAVSLFAAFFIGIGFMPSTPATPAETETSTTEETMQTVTQEKTETKESESALGATTEETEEKPAETQEVTETKEPTATTETPAVTTAPATTKIPATTKTPTTTKAPAVTTTQAPPPTTTAAPTTTTAPPVTTQNVQTSSFVLNTNTKKVHIPSCRHVKNIDAANRSDYQGTLNDILSQGYTTCGTCF